MPYTIDESTFPILRVVYDGAIDDDAFARHLEAYSNVLKRNERYSVILDASTASVPNARQRQMQATFQLETAQQTARLCVGGAFVIRSALVRGALTAILWRQPLPFRHVVLASAGEAETWCREQLASAGLSV